MPWGDMFMKAEGPDHLNPFAETGIAKIVNDPKIAKYLSTDSVFRGQLEELKEDPNNIMSLMGKDPRWMEAFTIMTGVDMIAL